MRPVRTGRAAFCRECETCHTQFWRRARSPRHFPGVKALDKVDFSLEDGAVHALVGENGAGKSTLMLTLGGSTAPTAGRSCSRAARCPSLPHDANRAGISVVYQDLSLVPNLSVAENIFAHRQPVRGANLIDWDTLHAQDHASSSPFSAPSRSTRAPPCGSFPSPSGRWWRSSRPCPSIPKMLILDEPTSSLTEVETRELFENIRKLKARGISVIYISHHLPEIFEIADTVTILRDGRYVCDARGEATSTRTSSSPTWWAARSPTCTASRPPAPPRLAPVPRFEARGLARGPSSGHRLPRGRGGDRRLRGARRARAAPSWAGPSSAPSPRTAGTMTLDGRADLRRDRRSRPCASGLGYLTEDRKTPGAVPRLLDQGQRRLQSPERFLRLPPRVPPWQEDGGLREEEHRGVPHRRPGARAGREQPLRGATSRRCSWAPGSASSRGS